MASLAQSGVSGGNSLAAKFVSFTFDLADQMTDTRPYSTSSANAANIEVHSRYNFDGAERLNSLTHATSEIAAGQAWNGTAKLPTLTIAAFNLIYDRDNRLTTLASYTNRFKTDFTYDTTDQIATAATAAITGLAVPSFLPTNESYNVDNNGNRRTAAVASQSAAGTHNRLQTDGNFNFTCDNEGNLTVNTAIIGGARTEYTWDQRNRLTTVVERTSGGVVQKRSFYNFGNRQMGQFQYCSAQGLLRKKSKMTNGITLALARQLRM